MKIIYLIFLQVVSYAVSFNFEDSQQAGVTLERDSDMLQVTVNENNNGGRTKVLRITEVHERLQLITAATAHPEVIDAQVEEQDSDYIITVNLLDYDKLIRDNVETAFVIGVQEGDDLEYFTLNIQNIDDESPSLEEHPCLVDEEVIIDVSNSKCRLYVSDPDGWLSGINFKIIGELEDIFGFKYRKEPEDSETWSYVYLVLKEGKKLDYETRSIYHISVEATDAAGHPSDPQTVTFTVFVQDQPPVWIDFPVVKHLNEATNASFVIVATDNDTNSWHEVNYEIFDTSGFVTVDGETGIITITSIYGQPDKEKYFDGTELDVIAYYSEKPNLITIGKIILIFDDIDDNVAKIDPLDKDSNGISVRKGCGTLNFSTQAVDSDITDKYAAYSIDLIVPDNVKSAFDFSPKEGNRSTTIFLSVHCSEFDFSDPKWRSFYIELRTTGIKTPDNIDSLSIRVDYADAIDLSVNWVLMLLLACGIIYSQ